MQGVQLALVALQVGAEGGDQAGGLLLGGGVKAPGEHLVHGDDANGLLDLLPGTGEGVAEGGHVEGRAGRVGE